MSVRVDVPVKTEVEVNIYDVRVDGDSLKFDAMVDRDGDIRIEISKEDFLRVAKDVYGLVEATDE